jgi:hypothetical protein
LTSSGNPTQGAESLVTTAVQWAERDHEKDRQSLSKVDSRQNCRLDFRSAPPQNHPLCRSDAERDARSSPAGGGSVIFHGRDFETIVEEDIFGAFIAPCCAVWQCVSVKMLRSRSPWEDDAQLIPELDSRCLRLRRRSASINRAFCYIFNFSFARVSLRYCASLPDGRKR